MLLLLFLCFSHSSFYSSSPLADFSRLLLRMTTLSEFFLFTLYEAETNYAHKICVEYHHKMYRFFHEGAKKKIKTNYYNQREYQAAAINRFLILLLLFHMLINMKHFGFVFYV